MVDGPGAHLRSHRDRPYALQARTGHARAHKSERDPRIVAGEIQAACERDAEIRVAYFARVEIDALRGGIDSQLQPDAVKDQRVWIGWRGRQHRATAGDLQPPDAAAVLRRIQPRPQPDARAAGGDPGRRGGRAA